MRHAYPSPGSPLEAVWSIKSSQPKGKTTALHGAPAAGLHRTRTDTSPDVASTLTMCSGERVHCSTPPNAKGNTRSVRVTVVTGASSHFRGTLEGSDETLSERIHRLRRGTRRLCCLSTDCSTCVCPEDCPQVRWPTTSIQRSRRRASRKPDRGYWSDMGDLRCDSGLRQPLAIPNLVPRPAEVCALGDSDMAARKVAAFRTTRLSRAGNHQRAGRVSPHTVENSQALL